MWVRGQSSDSATGEGGFAVGRQLSQYRILRHLGRGGMGRVYLARDTRLERDVALKILPPGFAADRLRVERFRREARSIAALSHPNIVTIFSADEVDGTHFLAMEYVRGKTLSAAIPRGGFKLERLFEIAIPLVDAVSVAHDNDIIHRDLKPSNVMLTADGLVKVLDFGLAKTVRLGTGGGDSGAATDALTREGALLGTTHYMSPEQMRGEELDQRTDVFSIGVVLYEMATGRHPFAGNSSADLVSSVMRDQPAPLGERREDMPHHLERIVERCLEKDPEHRYQSVKDLRNDLLFLRREIAAADDPPTVRTRRIRRVRGPLLGAVAGFALASVAGLLLGRGEPGMPQGRPRQVTADTGWEAEAVISPDGETLAYTATEAGNEDIWLVDVRGSGRLRLTEHSAADRSPAWFPDGSAIAFESDRGGTTAIWKVPRLGGTPIMLVAEAGDPAVSPDGTRIAFARLTATAESRIGVAPLSEPTEITLLTGPGDGLWGQAQPAWSPDGKRLAYADANDLWLVPATGGEPRRLTTASAGDEEPAWSSDGRYIFFSSYREATLALWRISARGGEPRRLTDGTGPERHPSVSRDGTRLAYTTYVHQLSLELLDLASGERQRLLGGRSDWGAVIAPDRTALVFVSRRGGSYNLWRQELAGSSFVGSPHRLSDESSDAATPAFSPDGAWIAYHRRNELGHRNIWIVPSSGGVPRAVTTGAGVRVHPSFSPDGSSIAYVSDLEGRSSLWVVPVAAGAAAGPARELTAGADNLYFPVWSPAGDRVAYLGATEGVLEVWVTAVDGGFPPRRLTSGADAGCLRWSAASGKLVVSGLWGGEAMSLRELDPDSGELSPIDPVVEFRAGESGLFDLSADGRLVALTREEERGDLWIFEAEKRLY